LLDPHVLLGARPLLAARAVRWVLFEYGLTWRMPQPELAVDRHVEGAGAGGRGGGGAGAPANATLAAGVELGSLEAVTRWLGGFDYVCFLAMEEQLVSLYGPWWRPFFEFYEWSNVLCGLGRREAVDVGADATRVLALAPTPEVEAAVHFYNSGPRAIPGLHKRACEAGE